MFPFASHLIHTYYTQKSQSKTKDDGKGFIAVTFDQRNHGTRLVSKEANEAWRSGNEMHAPDMFGQYAGTAVDTGVIIDYLDSYILLPGAEAQGKGAQPRITRNIALGISLGGHACWHLLTREPRIDGVCIVIGCPDYQALMYDRARLSKRKTWTESQGRDFFGSKDFTFGLVDAVEKVDPAGVFGRVLRGMGVSKRREWEGNGSSYSDYEKNQLVPVLRKSFAGKRVMLLSGGVDELVPYKIGEPFLKWLKRVSGLDNGGKGEGVWDAKSEGLVLEDVVFEGVGHECPAEMVPYMERWVRECMGVEGTKGGTTGHRESHI
jgi:pimeloyl-ACP methyl ester carboxylesterase